MKGTGNIRTEINSRTANVVFEVKGEVHRLKIPSKTLKMKDMVFGSRHFLPQEVLGFELIFPAAESLHDLNKLKDMWNNLVTYGFKKAK
jgi:hypothetical protein